jgi:hypothetical protein
MDKMLDGGGVMEVLRKQRWRHQAPLPQGTTNQGGAGWEENEHLTDHDADVNLIKDIGRRR